MKKIFIMGFLILLSCKQEATYFKKTTVTEIAKGNVNLPLPYDLLIVPIKLDKFTVVLTTIDALRRQYLDYYFGKYRLFSDFLFNVLNKKTLLHKEQFHETDLIYFKEDSKIEENFTYLPLNTLLNQYCDKINDKKFSVKTIYKQDKLYTLLYCFSINDYFVSFNDNIGRYSIYK